VNSRIVCIAGGSGAGKTTLAEGLIVHQGDRASLLSLDEYQKSKKDVPHMPSGRPNYDHPDAVAWGPFLRDLAALRSDADIHLRQKRKCSSMDGGVLPAADVIVPARPLIIVEGYLALWHPDARAMYDLAVFLDGPPELRLARRRWAKDPQYVDEVLLPMHDLYIEPTKAYADLIIDVAAASRTEVLETALAALAARGFI